MGRYIAFLRGINVGGHTVKMDRLRKILEDSGLEHVETFIASGNVIVESSKKGAALERHIEGHLRESLGYDVATFVRSDADLAAIAGYQPFPVEDIESAGASLYILFTHEPLSAERRRNVLELSTGTNEFHVHGREVYWLCRTKLSDSPLFKRGLTEKAIGVPTTSRNATTIRKLAAIYGAKSRPKGTR